MLYQRALQGSTDKETSDGEATQLELELHEGSFSHYAEEAIVLAMELGLFQESAADVLNPKGIVTREEAALVTAKWLKAVEHISSDTTEGGRDTTRKFPPGHPWCRNLIFGINIHNFCRPRISTVPCGDREPGISAGFADNSTNRTEGSRVSI